MRFFLKHLSGAALLRAGFAAALVLAAPLASGQPYGAFHVLFPYNGNILDKFPRDLSKAVVGSTPAEACAKRTDFELTFVWSAQLQAVHPIQFVGLLPSGNCGFQWPAQSGFRRQRTPNDPNCALP